MPRGKAAHEEQVHEQVEVGGDRLAVHGQGAGERRGVEQTALLVREHRPEPAQGLRRDAWPELRDVALEVGADEIRAPAQARRVRCGQQTFRKPTAQPQGIEALATNLAGVERGELQIADASRERLARLFEQVDRCRAQDENPPLAPPAPPSGVDKPSQVPEELRHALDLVEDDELVLVSRQIELRLGELGPIGFGLEIEIDRRPRLGDFERQRSLARLTRPQQRRRRGFGQGSSERGEEPAGNHPCNYGVTLQKCKDRIQLAPVGWSSTSAVTAPSAWSSAGYGWAQQR